MSEFQFHTNPVLSNTAQEYLILWNEIIIVYLRKGKTNQMWENWTANSTAVMSWWFGGLLKFTEDDFFELILKISKAHSSIALTSKIRDLRKTMIIHMWLFISKLV